MGKYMSSKKALRITQIFLFVALYFHYTAENNSFSTISGRLTLLAISLLTMLFLFFWYKEDRANARVAIISVLIPMGIALLYMMLFVLE